MIISIHFIQSDSPLNCFRILLIKFFNFHVLKNWSLFNLFYWNIILYAHFINFLKNHFIFNDFFYLIYLYIYISYINKNLLKKSKNNEKKWKFTLKYLSFLFVYFWSLQFHRVKMKKIGIFEKKNYIKKQTKNEKKK